MGGVRKGSITTLEMCEVVSMIWTRTVEVEGGMLRFGIGWAMALKVEFDPSWEY